MANRPPGKPDRKKGMHSALPVSNILPAVGRALNLDKKVQEWSVLSLWQEVIDPPFDVKSRAVRVKFSGGKNHLQVMVSNPAVASELSFYLQTYQQRINSYAPQTGLEIHQIDLRVG